MNRNTYLQQPLPIEKELKTMFPGKKPLLMIEIGACEGEDTIKYARLFPAAGIYAFEPLRSNIELAGKNFERNNIHNVSLIGKAISDKSGSAPFHVSSGNPADAEPDWNYGNKSSSLLYPEKHTTISDFIKFDHSTTVETITLDEFCKQNDIRLIDFIHMDVQGAELKVLRGAANSLRSIKAIWLEVSTVDLYKDQPLADEIDSFMQQHGFVMVKDCLYGISGERLYISKAFFPKYRRLFPAWTRRRSFLRKVLRKAGF